MLHSQRTEGDGKRGEPPANSGFEERVAHHRLEVGEELAPAGGPGERQVEAPGDLALVAGAVHAGDLLLDVLAEEAEAAQVDPEVGADLLLVVALDRQAEEVCGPFRRSRSPP